MKDKILSYAKKVATNRYVWVGAVAFVLGAATGNTQYVDREVIKEVVREVPAERATTNDQWQELKSVDDDIIYTYQTALQAASDGFTAAGVFMEDFDAEKFEASTQSVVARMNASTERLQELNAKRDAVVTNLEK